jgi:mono/diheme cytochrome c family protein
VAAGFIAEVVMLLNLLGLGALIFLAYVFFTLFLKSLRSHHLAVKLLGGILSGLLALVFVAALGAGLYGLWRTDVPRVRTASDLKVTATPELVARGAALASSCIPCHSADGAPYLNGGAANLAASWGPYGAVYGQNLTPAGEVASWTDGEIVRAVREGIDKSGLPLVGHPSQAYRSLGDDDAAALVAYLRSQPALRHDQPARRLNLLALWAVAGGLLPTSELPPLPSAAAAGGGGG